MFGDALGGIEHRQTRPHRPQTNGEVERFHRPLPKNRPMPSCAAASPVNTAGRVQPYV